MSISSGAYVEFVKDQLISLRGVSPGRFFGGMGLSSEGTQFAMIMGNALYFVVDDSTRLKYEKMGSNCFSYSTKKGRIDVRKYYAVPTEVMEQQEQLVALARESISIAKQSKSSPTGRPIRSRIKRIPD